MTIESRTDKRCGTVAPDITHVKNTYHLNGHHKYCPFLTTSSVSHHTGEARCFFVKEKISAHLGEKEKGTK